MNKTIFKHKIHISGTYFLLTNGRLRFTWKVVCPLTGGFKNKFFALKAQIVCFKANFL